MSAPAGTVDHDGVGGDQPVSLLPEPGILGHVANPSRIGASFRCMRQGQAGGGSVAKVLPAGVSSVRSGNASPLVATR